MTATDRLGELTLEEVRQVIADRKTVILPVGAVEQHGPHLPLETDVLIPSRLAELVAERHSAVLAPAHAWGAHSQVRSGGGRSFPGSVGVPPAVLSEVVESVIGEFLRQGFARIAVLNGHFENTSPVSAALEALLGPGARFAESGSRAVLINWWELLTDADLQPLFGDGFPGWEAEHAGVVETSLMEALVPELVRAERKAAGGAPRKVAYDVFPAPADVIWSNGIGSTALPASAAVGERMVELLVERMALALETELG